jgi:glutathione peroxidase
MRALLLSLPALVLLALAHGPARAESPPAAAGGAFAFAFTAIEGGPLPLARYAGRPLLVVNTASQCGYTYQYAALQRVWERYRGRGLVVLGVPSNDFRQETADNAAIKTFCQANFDADFPLTERVGVRGPASHPLFAWLRAELGEATAGPRWNFHKYLIAPDGRAVAAWPSGVEPDSPEVTRAIEELLPPPATAS